MPSPLGCLLDGREYCHLLRDSLDRPGNGPCWPRDVEIYRHHDPSSISKGGDSWANKSVTAELDTQRST